MRRRNSDNGQHTHGTRFGEAAVTAERVAAIRRRLEEAFTPDELEIVDDSHRHAGHAGARDGRGHFHVRIVSAVFSGKKRLDRHRLVYGALGTLMETDIHALGVIAISPDDASAP
jgi:BolA protein